MVMDMVLEQILVRLVMSEALLVSPLLGTFVITEFIMTMSSEDLLAFVISYFIEQCIVMFSRVFLGPAIERLELFTQQLFIRLSLRFKFFRDCFKKILTNQLASQLQLMSLNEFNNKRMIREDDDTEGAKGRSSQKRRFMFQREKGEGLEALLGSVSTYASQT